jgi:peptide/nickel transport system substrate-binding protein
MNKIITLICIFIVLSGCSFLGEETELTQGIYFFPSGLDPAVNTNLIEHQIFSQIYETLLTLDNDYQTLLPCLAESWSVSNDHLTYSFKLRSNVLFHDGSRLSADAVRYSFLRQININSESPLFNIIDTINIVNSLTIEIMLKHPFMPFPYTLASPNGLMVISKKALEKYGEDIGKYPVGTGPYYMDHWEENKYITLRAYPDYREKNAIDIVKFIMPDSTEQAEILFKNGELDILYMVASHWLDRLKWSGRVKYYVQSPLSTLFVGFNLSNNPVNNRSIRDAVRYALETRKAVYLTNRGNAISAHGPLPPIYPGFDDLVQQKFHPELSLKLLKDAGYDNGIILNLYAFAPTFSRQTRIEIIKSQLSKVGITVNTTLYNDWDKFIDALESKDCQLFLGGYSSELIGDPGNFLYSLFHSNSPHNHFKYKNEEVDRLIEHAFEQVGQQERHKTYRAVVKKVLESTPAVFESHIKSHFAYNSNKIKSLVVNPYEFIYFHRVEIYE